MEDDRDARLARLAGQTDDDVRRMMQSVPGVSEVMFTSGEPTLHPRLPEYVRWARDGGFATVGLITNGRRLAYRPYARELLENGLNHVLVSIHGPDAATHDGLTRTNGSFVQALAGMANLKILRREFPNLKVHTSFVVNRRNYKLFREFYDVMTPFQVDQHVFNVVMPDGRGGRFFEQLMPRYSDVATEFGRFVAMLPPEGVSRVFLLDIPYCTTTKLPDPVRGYVERYFHFEPEGTVRMDADDGGPGDEPAEDGELFARRALESGGRAYSKVAKSSRDQQIRVKRPECEACGYFQPCRGVFRIYVERFGWDEFVPVRNAGR